MGLVSLGSAMIAVSAVTLPQLQDQPDALSRTVQGVIQGIMAGIGFLGAGVLIQRQREMEVHGMTTAAAIWATAALGIMAGLAAWPVFLIGSAVTLFLLIAAHPLEKAVEAWAEHQHDRRKSPEGD